MAVIDIGPGTGDYGAAVGAVTQIAVDNTANDTGTLDTFYIWTNENCSTCKMGTFYTSGYDHVSRDYENIGSVNAGSEQSFTGKNCDVTSGDYLGVYTNAKLEVNATGGAGRMYKSGDTFGTTTSYYKAANHKLAIYATGTTGGGATVKPHYYYLQQ